jgi:beta-lactamase class A
MLPADDLAAVMAEVSADAPAAAALYDYQTGSAWSYAGDRWFHAASTIKVAILACTYAALEARRLHTWHRLHIRNRFFSAVDGVPYRILASRDADAEVYRSVGRTMRIGDLAQHMIGTSSNLAANLLLGFIGVDWARARLSAAGMTGVDLVRGVEDDRAYESGISNRMTANGLVALLRAIFEGQFSAPAHTAEMIEILCGQQFNSGIPAGLPPNVRAVARVAHKTGEISTVTHDGGLVFLPGRPPYVLAVLTEMPADTNNRFERIATVSGRVFAGIADAGAAHTSLRP